MKTHSNSPIQNVSKIRRIRITKGFDLRIADAPVKLTDETKSSETSTLLGRDFNGVRLQLLCDEGSRVNAGEAVLCDRRHPEIKIVAPVSGTVSRINRGMRRCLVSLQISADEESESIQFKIPNKLDRDSIQNLMLESGIWSSLRQRPFDCIPDPGKPPQALLITAIDTQPLAADPAVIISKYSDEFSLGLKLLCDLVESPVYLCKSAQSDFEYDQSLRLEIAEFDGPHPAGLAGTHIHSLCPIGFAGEQAWHIGYQDVISLGYLVRNGTPWYQRIISLAGSAVLNPRLISVPLGAASADIVASELTDGAVRVISGSVFSGHLAVGSEACLGQRHNQITVLNEAGLSESTGWLSPLFDSNLAGTDPLIATANLDSVAPPGILAVPLLRALLVGDVERARDLGALELAEEDMALLSYFCPSGTDYGTLLRGQLEQIQKEGLSILA